ncbi:hypothetical protein D9M68_727730 [compost metagenome]
MAFTQETREAQAVLVRQADIQQHQIGDGGLQRQAQAGAVGATAYLVAMPAEVVFQQLTHLGVVVHHQDLHVRLHSRLPHTAPSQHSQASAGVAWGHDSVEPLNR